MTRKTKFTKLQRATILEKTAEILDRDGWTTYTYHTPEGSHCLVGAANKTKSELSDVTEAAINAALYDFAEDNIQKIPQYNRTYSYLTCRNARSHAMSYNDSQNNKTQVINPLRETAKRLRKEAAQEALEQSPSE